MDKINYNLSNSINRLTEIADFQQQFRRSSNCFFVIACLALAASLIQPFVRGSDLPVSSLISAFGFEIPFLITAFAGLSSESSYYSIDNAHLITTVVLAIVFIVVGLDVRRQQYWALVIGIILYTLESLIALLFAVITPLSLMFHIFMLILLYRDFKALRKIKESQKYSKLR